MLYRILDLRYSRKKGGIDDEPLQRLLHGHEIVTRRDRLYHFDGEPHLLVSVLYRLAPLGEAPPREGSGRGRTDSSGQNGGTSDRSAQWRSLLSEADMPLFESLRAWRSRRAREEAVPAYVILTNVQLARASNARPRTLAALGDAESGPI